MVRIRIYARETWSTDAQLRLVHTMSGRKPNVYLPDVRERVADALRAASLRVAGTEDNEGGVVFYLLLREWQAHQQQIEQAIRSQFPRW